MEPYTSLQLSWKVFAKDHALDNLDFSTLFTLPIPFCLEFKFYKGYPILRILLLDKRTRYHIFNKKNYYNQYFQYVLQTMSIDENDVIFLTNLYRQYEYNHDILSAKNYLKIELFSSKKLIENNVHTSTPVVNQKKDVRAASLTPSKIKN